MKRMRVHFVQLIKEITVRYILVQDAVIFFLHTNYSKATVDWKSKISVNKIAATRCNQRFFSIKVFVCLHSLQYKN